MKILCLCLMGHVRSHAMKLAVELRGHEAINAGIVSHSSQTLKMLGIWADLILVAEPEFVQEYQEKTGDKETRIISIDLGPDTWRTRVDDLLLKAVQKAIRKTWKEPW